MEIWNKLKQPPASALKTIRAGRLKGMSDINPQWRYQIMTEQFGPCGIGWKYEIKRLWTEPASENQILAFAEILLYIAHGNGSQWSDPIPGIGGSTLVAKESKGLYSSDEAYKMAVTDALSVAMKMLGVAADIYAGLWDGSKYRESPKSGTSGTKDDKKDYGTVSDKQWSFIKKLGTEHELTDTELKDMIKWLAKKENIPNNHYKIAKLLLPDKNFNSVFTEYCEYQSARDREDGADIPY